MINNIHEFKNAFMGGEREKDQQKVVSLISQKLYKHSPNGLGLIGLGTNGKRTDDPFVWGVAVTGIVENTDIEGIRPLMFPFEMKDFWAACNSLAEELDDAEAEWRAQGED